MNRKKLYLILLILFLIIYSIISCDFIKAQQLNPPNKIRLLIYDIAGISISKATISVDFKPLGLTDNNGVFIFENKGEFLSISKPGYITKLLQLQSYWKGDMKVNLESIKYKKDKIEDLNYTRTLFLNEAPLINQKLLIIENDGLSYYEYTDINGKLDISFKKNSKIYIFYLQQKQNSLFFYFSELKEWENDSILNLSYAVYNTYNFNFEEEILPDLLIAEGENSIIKIPLTLKTKPINPYYIILGSDDYDFFNRYNLFIHYSIQPEKILKNSKDKSFFSSSLLTCNLKLNETFKFNSSYLLSVFNEKLLLNYREIGDGAFKSASDLFDFYFIDQSFFELKIKRNKHIKLSKIYLYNNLGDLVIEAFVFDKINIPFIYFEKKYSFFIEMFPDIEYDYLINNTNIFSQNSYFSIIYNLP